MRADIVNRLTAFASITFFAFAFFTSTSLEAQSANQQHTPAQAGARPAAQANQAQRQQRPLGQQGQQAVRPPTDTQQRVADQRRLSAQPMPAAARKPIAPAWHTNMSKAQQDYIMQLLNHWEKSSDQVRHYKCDFMRWDYSGDLGWRNPKTRELTANQISQGEIRYSAPDRATYETTKSWGYGKPETPGGQPSYEAMDIKNIKERWLCDGKAIYSYEYQNKKLYETAIPKEMQGKGLMETPLPFFFGAKADDMLSRYWVRIVTPKEVEKEYWLEAIPKRASDTQMYSKLVLILSETDFLPQSLEIFSQNYDEKNNQLDRRVFVFKNRKSNGIGQSLTDWGKRFLPPTTPIGWERVDTVALAKAQSRQRPQALPRPQAMAPPTQKRR